MKIATNYSAEITRAYHNDVSFLKNVVEQYPASSFANFLYLYELKRLQDDDFEKAAAKTALYFTNPLWLQYQLQFQNVIEIVEEEGIEEEETEEEKVIEEEREEVYDNDILEEELSANVLDTSSLKEEITEEEAAEDRKKEQQTEFVKGASLPGDGDQIEEVFAGSQEVDEEHISDKPDILDDGSVTSSNSAVETLHREEDHQPESKNLSESEKELEFEPLHTVDYFASQGITIRESALANDKLSNQVKSFTAWLKTMKTLHPGKIPEQNEVVEKIIQTSAEESNTQTDILTEAMADVLLKQNKKEKAIEMYEKLSLMNPAKSTYFAAKIESIKHSNI